MYRSDPVVPKHLTGAQHGDAKVEGGRSPDISNIVAEVTPPPPIDIPVEHELTAEAVTRWNSQTDGNRRARGVPSLDTVFGITDDTVSWGTIRTPGPSTYRSTAQAVTENGVVAWVVIRGLQPGVYPSR